MGKNRNHELGFGLVEIILVIAVLGLMGVIGWLVYTHYKNAPATIHTPPSSTTSDTLYAGWQTYTDANVTLRYPAGWDVKGITLQTEPVQWSVQITSAQDPAIGIRDLPTATNKRLQFTIAPLSASTAATCRVSCKVYDVLPLSIVKSHGARLVISDWGSQNSAQELEVVDDQNVTSGATTYKLGATVNGKQTRIYGNIGYDVNSSLGAINDVAAFEKTQSFQDLLKVLDSVSIQ